MRRTDWASLDPGICMQVVKQHPVVFLVMYSKTGFFLSLSFVFLRFECFKTKSSVNYHLLFTLVLFSLIVTTVSHILFLKD